MKKLLIPATFVLVPLILLGGLAPRASAQEEDPTPFLNGLASFVLPGAGQFLNDEGEKAIQHFLIIVGIDTANILLARGGFYYYTPYPLGIAHLAWSAYSAYDAYQVARRGGGNIFGSGLEDFDRDPVNPDEGVLWAVEKEENLPGFGELAPYETELSLSPIDE
ncbi:hypothetical protein KGY64_02540 [Candidatus Bipolaricaulota bacterium]|nr:hypothetical protein [Candidatus Bipolaricaulota bacterium]